MHAGENPSGHLDAGEKKNTFGKCSMWDATRGSGRHEVSQSYIIRSVAGAKHVLPQAAVGEFPPGSRKRVEHLGGGEKLVGRGPRMDRSAIVYAVRRHGL